MSCPGCKSLFRLPEELAGEQVRCQKCKQLFVVSMPMSGTIEPPVLATEPAPEASSPSAPPGSAPIEPTAPQAPADEVVMATVAEPKKEKPQPPPLPKTPMPTERPASALGALALLLLFVLGMFATGTFATIWIFTHLSPPLPIATASPLKVVREANQNAFWDENRNKNADKDKIREKDDRFWKENHPAVMPVPINLGPGDKAFVPGLTQHAAFVDHGKWGQDGPYSLYRVHLKEATTYHFYVGAFQVEPRLRVLAGEDVVADRLGQAPHDRVIVAYQPKRSGDYLLWITTRERVPGRFDLVITPESRANPIQVDLTVQPTYTDNHALRIEDSLDPGPNGFGPYRDYEVKLEAEKEYNISIVNARFLPVLRIDDNKPMTAPPIVGQFPPPLNHTFRPPTTGKYRVRVTSEHYGVGDYTLKIVPRSIAVQTILAAPDENGTYVDRRAFTPSDPNQIGRGPYKAYLVQLEEGKTYRVEMSLGNSPTSLTAFSPNNEQVGDVSGRKDAALTIVARQSGTYRIHAAADLPKVREEYTLRITTQP
jgi:predicted Zn finger-like uncharacterized protein